MKSDQVFIFRFSCTCFPPCILILLLEEKDYKKEGEGRGFWGLSFVCIQQECLRMLALVGNNNNK